MIRTIRHEMMRRVRMTSTPKNKKSPKPLKGPEDCTLSLHPEAMCLHPSCGGHSTILSRQVFWLLDHPTDRPFPRSYPLSGFIAAFVPKYSGGTTPDSHRVPSWPTLFG